MFETVCCECRTCAICQLEWIAKRKWNANLNYLCRCWVFLWKQALFRWCAGDLDITISILFRHLTMSWDDLQHNNNTRYSVKILQRQQQLKICTKKSRFAVLVLTMNGGKKIYAQTKAKTFLSKNTYPPHTHIAH